MSGDDQRLAHMWRRLQFRGCAQNIVAKPRLYSLLVRWTPDASNEPIRYLQEDDGCYWWSIVALARENMEQAEARLDELKIEHEDIKQQFERLAKDTSAIRKIVKDPNSCPGNEKDQALSTWGNVKDDYKAREKEYKDSKKMVELVEELSGYFKLFFDTWSTPEWNIPHDQRMRLLQIKGLATP